MNFACLYFFKLYSKTLKFKIIQLYSVESEGARKWAFNDQYIAKKKREEAKQA